MPAVRRSPWHDQEPLVSGFDVEQRVTRWPPDVAQNATFVGAGTVQIRAETGTVSTWIVAPDAGLAHAVETIADGEGG
jgi:hypothetical protein